MLQRQLSGMLADLKTPKLHFHDSTRIPVDGSWSKMIEKMLYPEDEKD